MLLLETLRNLCTFPRNQGNIELLVQQVLGELPTNVTIYKS